jgi:hypothetical protein
MGFACESDLSWYWWWSEGEMGVPSNFVAMANAMRLGPAARGTPTTELDEGKFEAARKARRIGNALRLVEPGLVQVLFAAFGPFACELPVFGVAAPIAPMTSTARNAHRASNTNRCIEDWLVRLAHRASKGLGGHVAEDKAIAHAIAAEANGALSRAARAFGEAVSTASRVGRLRHGHRNLWRGGAPDCAPSCAPKENPTTH